MEPTLLDKNEYEHHLVNYSAGIIIRRYEQNGAEYYFTLHMEQAPEEDALVPTGRLLCVLLTPKGLRTFFLIRNTEGKYEIDTDEENSNLEGRDADFYVSENGELQPGPAVLAHELAAYNNLGPYLQLINQVLSETKQV